MGARNFSATSVATTLSSSVTSGSATMTLGSLAGLPAYPYTLILEQGTGNMEEVEVTSLSSGTTVNVTRGVDGTPAVSHASGVTCVHGVGARDYQEPNTHINDATLHVSDTDTWHAPTLLNGWINFGGTFQVAQYRLDSTGRVDLRGLIKSGTTTAGTALLTLPALYRPASDRQIGLVAGGGAFLINVVGATGNINIATVPTGNINLEFAFRP